MKRFGFHPFPPILLLIFFSALSLSTFSDPYSSQSDSNASAPANPIVLVKHDIPNRYTVKPGDTLWDISALFLRDPWMWPEIWYANQQIDNPHLIYPGDIISLVYVDGVPQLRIKRSRWVKLSPTIRSLDHAEAISALPLDVIDNFLSHTRVTDDATLEATPYVLSGTERRVLVGMGDDFYTRGDFAPNAPHYGIYRRGEPYIDPETNELLGIRATEVGGARIKVIADDIATLNTTRANGEIRIKDRLLVSEQRTLASMFYPRAPERQISGSVLSIEDGVRNAGALDVIAVNRGTRDGLQEGDTLAIFKRGDTVADRVAKERIRLPEERIGLVMVFYTYNKMSFALVMEADRQIDLGDILRNP